jgi:hypothetical protein
LTARPPASGELSKLEAAMEQLDRAVARLESAGAGTERETEHKRLRDLVSQMATRVDNALAKIDLALKWES